MILLWPSLDEDEGSQTNWFSSKPITIFQLYVYKSSLLAVSKAQHGCIDCLALMICAELQVPGLLKGSTTEKINIVRKNDNCGWCFIMSIIVHLLSGVHLTYIVNVAQKSPPPNTLFSHMWSIKYYMMRVNYFLHLGRVTSTQLLGCQLLSLFVYAWLMFSSVSAKKFLTPARNGLRKELFRASFNLLRYLSWLSFELCGQ